MPKTTLSRAGKLSIPVLVGFGLGLALRRPDSWMPVGNRHVPQPAREVDPKLYLGKWYELFRYENYFELGCEATTAEYGLLPDGKISVRNACRLGSPAGKEKVAKARAKITPDSGNAKLKVSFFGPFYIGNYWVLDRAEDYSWSIVGEPSGKYLWILARDPHLAEPIRQMLVRRTAELGYDTSLLRPTQHP